VSDSCASAWEIRRWGLFHTPPVLIAFDVLYVKGRDVSQRPLHERRARLEDIVAGAGFIYPVRRLAPDGLDAWAEVVERG